ncbi:hypothetical protein [Streptomyces sp. ITFR-6]|uniref:hypothetical protein n=1 Tax=Streptomyces sp. ITFR-6 TaxID=3075197 RepID=UPI00288A2019|nr:hypothetical protein [Streptomyces sp. ITFR-6]WNI34362.1 hypothetical protein RLT59_08035 [Streptomyces sp. ITFR-6]
MPPSKAGTIDAADTAGPTEFEERVRKVYGRPVAKDAGRTTTCDRVAVRKDIEHGQRVIAGAWRRVATGTTAKPCLGRTTLHRATD